MADPKPRIVFNEFNIGEKQQIMRKSLIISKEDLEKQQTEANLSSPYKLHKRSKSKADLIDCEASSHAEARKRKKKYFSNLNEGYNSQITLAISQTLGKDNGIGSVEDFYDLLEINEEGREQLRKLNTEEFPKEGEFVGTPTAPKLASFSQLLLCLTSPETNIEVQKIFIITFTSITTPEMVLGALLTRYFAEVDPNSNIKTKEQLKQIRDRMIRILSSWLNTGMHLSEKVLVAVKKFSEILNALPDSALKAIIISKAVQQVQNGSSLHLTSKAAPPSILPSTPEDTWKILDIDHVELARQITLVHSKIFLSIGPSELLTVIWSAKKTGGSPNIQKLTKHFDMFSRYVMLLILNGESPKERAKIFEYFVDTAITLKEINNFNGVFAIMYGLTHASIQRLDKTLKYVNKSMKRSKKKIYDDLVSLCDFHNDFVNYREVIKEAIEPCIPFIGCFQKDLVYVQEKYPNQINGLHNFEKFKSCVDLIKLLERFQNERYPFTKNKTIKKLITDFPEIPETIEMMKISASIEKKDKK